MSSASRLQRLDSLAREANPTRKKLVALALLGDRLSEDGIRPVLVGGAAVELYTSGGYATKDVDLALPLCPEVEAAFDELGFTRQGRYWYRADLDLLFEAPAPADLPGEDAPRTVVDVEGMPVYVLGLEDLILDRLRGWVHWRSDEDGRWARRLVQLHADRIDREYLHRKVAGNDSERQALRTLLEETEPLP
ncbi:MAG TPA: UbiD family decarboxylase [Thermoanaerobaculia bacterium]|nr:UbiD family decarboxylase [Thermoanaerobaculia bacterium]